MYDWVERKFGVSSCRYTAGHNGEKGFTRFVPVNDLTECGVVWRRNLKLVPGGRRLNLTGEGFEG